MKGSKGGNDNNQELVEKTLESQEVFSGNLLKLFVKKVRGPKGEVGEREVVCHPGGVVILPVISAENVDELLLVKQYREPAGKTLWELPAGTLEEGESFEDCARRELIEETRFRPGKLEKKVEFYTSPGYSDENLALYLASKLEKVKDSENFKSPKGENLITERFPVSELFRKARKGKIRDGKTLAGLFFLALEKNG